MQNWFKSLAQQFASHKILELAVDPQAHSAYAFFSAEVCLMMKLLLR